MTALGFFRGDSVRGLLERTHADAGMAVALHYLEGRRESPRILSWGGCAACRHVAARPGGMAACSESRRHAAEVACRHARPLPFQCHMGFTCVSVPLLPGAGFVLTLGPYAPGADRRALIDGARRGLRSLDRDAARDAPLPFDLADVPSGSTGLLLERAERLAEAIQQEWDARMAPGTSAAAAPVAEAAAPSAALAAPERSGPRGRQRRKTPGSAALDFAAVAALLAGGNRARARLILANALQSPRPPAGRRIPVLRARALAMTAGTLEAAEHAGLDTGAAWEAHASSAAHIAEAGGDEALLDAMFVCLRGIHAPAAAKASKAAGSEVALNKVLLERLAEPLTLGEVAAALGLGPSAISHRLKRRYGMTFSEYLGRLRMGKARELLRRTRLPIAEVGRRVGIPDQSNFARLFRKYERVSPAAYRKQCGRFP